MSNENLPDEVDSEAISNRSAIERLRVTLSRNQFFKSVVLLAGGTVIGQGTAILAAPLLTRIYTPSEFGVLAVYASYIGIFGAVMSLRYEWAIPLAKRDADAAKLIALSTVVLLAMTLALAAGVLLLGERLAPGFPGPKAVVYRWLIPAGALAVGGYQILNYWAIRRRHFKDVAKTKISQGVGMTLTQLILGFLGLGPLGLILGDIVGRTMGVVGLSAKMLRMESGHLQDLSAKGLREVSIEYRRFPLFSASSSLLNNCGLQIPALLFASLIGIQVAGWFALLQRVVLAPGVLVTQVISQVYLAELSTALKTESGLKDAKRLFLRVSVYLLMFGGIPIGILCRFAPRLFGALLGPSWERIGEYTQAITPLLVANIVAAPLSMTLVSRNRQSWQFIWDVVRLVLVTASIWIPIKTGIGDVGVMLSYGLAMTVMYVVLWILCLISLWHPLHRRND